MAHSVRVYLGFLNIKPLRVLLLCLEGMPELKATPSLISPTPDPPPFLFVHQVSLEPLTILGSKNNSLLSLVYLQN